MTLQLRLLDGHADAIAFDDLPTYVRNRVGRIAQFEIVVDQTRKVISLLPQLLAIGDLFKRVTLSHSPIKPAI